MSMPEKNLLKLLSLLPDQPGFLSPLPTADSVRPAARGLLTIPADATAVARNRGSLADAIPEESLAEEAERAKPGSVIQDPYESRRAADRALAQVLQVVSKQSGQHKVGP